MEPTCLLDDGHVNSLSQDLGKLNYGEYRDESSDTEDILLIQKRNPSEQKGLIMLEPLVAVTDGNEPSSVIVSSAAASRVTVPTSGGFVSATVSDFESPHVIMQPIAARETRSDILSTVTTRLESVFQESEFEVSSPSVS